MKIKVIENGISTEREATLEETVIIVQQQIADLKQNLAETDYKALKYAEGMIGETEYAPIKAQRQEWRLRINELEEILLHSNQESEE